MRGGQMSPLHKVPSVHHSQMLTGSDDWSFSKCLHLHSRPFACPRRRLSSRLDNIKKTACGDGHSHCLLCGASFGPQGVTAVLCVQCNNVGGLLS